MSKYYPEFYARRKRQHQVYMRATIGAVIIGVIALAVISAGYVYRAFFSAKSGGVGATPEMADVQRDLKIAERLDGASRSAADTDEAGSSASAERIELQDVQYAESFPNIGVTSDLGGGAGGAGSELAVDDPEVETETGLAGATQEPQDTTPLAPISPTPDGTPGREGADGSVSGSGKSEVEQSEEKARKAEAKRLAEEKSKAEAKRKADAKKAEQEKADAKAKADEKKDSEASKAPADTRKDEVRYVVYAGSFSSQAAANEAKSNLAALGLSGTIRDTKVGDFLVVVGSLEAYDDAKALRNKLGAGGFGEAFITKVTK